MNTLRWTFAATLLSAALAQGCVVNTGPRIRVATVTPAELAAVQDEPMVWYEFQPGDVVPVQLGFIGVVQGLTDQPVALRATKRFFLVMRKDQPMLISFDGETFAGPQSAQSIIAVLPREDGGPGAQVGWLHYFGESGDPEAEMKAMGAQKP